MSTSPIPPENNSPENLTLFLERLPGGRYDYYVESKNLYGYNEDLSVELKLVMKEFQETEKENIDIKQKFLAFIEETQKTLLSKEREISLLHDEIEKNSYVVKTLVTQNKEINEINQSKDEKINKLNMKTEEFESLINDLNSEVQGLNNEVNFFRGILKNPQNWKNIKNFQSLMEEYIEENQQEIKSKIPNLFCRCLGKIDEILLESMQLKQRNELLSNRIIEVEKHYEITESRMLSYERELRIVKKQNLKLSADLKRSLESKGQFLAQMEHELLLKTRKQAENIRMGSLSLIKKDQSEVPKIRTPLNRNRKKPCSLDETFNKQTEVDFQQKDNSLLNDLESSFGKSMDEKSFIDMLGCGGPGENEHKRKIKNKLSLMSATQKGVVDEDLGDCSEEKIINYSTLERFDKASEKITIKEIRESFTTKPENAGIHDYQAFFLVWSFSLIYKSLCSLFSFKTHGITNGAIVLWRGNLMVMKLALFQIKFMIIQGICANLVGFELVMNSMLKVKKILSIIALMGKTCFLINKKI